ncbi:MAG: primary-amine oxidase [Alphaproteobacteria bacterium]
MAADSVDMEKGARAASAEAAVRHPLEPLTRDEIARVSAIVRADMAELGEALRFEMIELLEPPKAEVRAFRPGDAMTRSARVNVYRTGSVGVWRLTVSLDHATVLTRTHLADACPMIQLEEFMQIEDAVKRDPRFIEACAKRGLSDMALICVDPWSAGNFGVPGEEGRHLSHTFCSVRSSAHDNLYAHPIEGLNAVVDIKTMEVIRVDDHGITPVPAKDVNFDREFLKEAPRSDLKPINVEQPEGVSFEMDGKRIRWHDWSILIGFNAREAITLHDISFADRPVCYRASLAEMAIPYGSPRAPHYRKNVFDVGEYGIGKLANSLELGCDCLGAIHYLDGWISDINGDPMCIRNAICIHEEDYGILWKHWDFRTDRTEVRRARRLVISSISTVGNYEYGSYWYFYLDGTMELEMKATGIINTVACEPGKPEKYGVEVSPGVVGQIHQHLFCARLDMAVDGDDNAVLECDTVAEPRSPDNPHGNAFYVRETKLATECGRPRKPEAERYWTFINPNKKNHVGRPVGYKLEPRNSLQVFNDMSAPSGQRMGFVSNHLWVTAYDPEERYPAGEFVNHSDGSDGVAAYAARGRSIDNADLVAWHVFGLHHQPRPEDFPVQPVVTTGFKLMASGFFDHNPALDLPYDGNKASCHADAAD